MRARGIATAVLGSFVAVSLGAVIVQEMRGTGTGEPGATATPPTGDILIAYYFHGNRRCATCTTIEAWAREALHQAFPDELESGRIAWRTLNFDEEGNAALRDRYGLYTSAIVLSDVRGGEERQWRDLEEIWSLTAEKPEFTEYVVRETRAALGSAP